MLFAKDASPVQPAPLTGPATDVARYFANLGIRPTLLATVFANLPNPGHYDDVDIVKVPLPHGTTVFDVTHALRAGPLSASPGSVSPNHVLVPAPHEYWCPYGPPAHLPQAPISYPAASRASTSP